MFFIHLCEVSRESAQEDHPSGAGRSVMTKEEELQRGFGVCGTGLRFRPPGFESSLKL